jgi:hypothetical protein
VGLHVEPVRDIEERGADGFKTGEPEHRASRSVGTRHGSEELPVLEEKVDEKPDT